VNRPGILPGMRIALVLLVSLAIAAPAAAGPSQADLVKRRVDAAAQVYTTALARWKAGTEPLDRVATWSVRWLTALREAPLKGAKLKTALAEHLARMKDLETAVADAVTAGVASAADRDAAAYYVAEAELWAARGK
jgi:hypothetical protein